MIYERVKQWREFSDEIENHLATYTVPQYGDVGEDAITEYSVDDCIKQIEKYTKRYGTQSRDGQQLLDFMKIAHYTQCAWEKSVNVGVVDDEKRYLVISDKPIDGYECIGDTMIDDVELKVWREK